MQVQVVPNFEFGVDNKTPEFLKMNPIGKVCYLSLYLRQRKAESSWPLLRYFIFFRFLCWKHQMAQCLKAMLLLVMVILQVQTSWILMVIMNGYNFFLVNLVAVVARLKGDNILYGSSQIDYVSLSLSLSLSPL